MPRFCYIGCTDVLYAFYGIPRGCVGTATTTPPRRRRRRFPLHTSNRNKYEYGLGGSSRVRGCPWSSGYLYILGAAGTRGHQRSPARYTLPIGVAACLTLAIGSLV